MLFIHVDMPLYISKPHCLDCDPEYFMNVSGYHPCRKIHDPYSGIEPVSNSCVSHSNSLGTVYYHNTHCIIVCTMHLHVHTHACTAYTHIHTHTYTHTHTHTHTHTYTHIHIHTHEHAHTYTHIHTYTQMYMHVHTHVQ